MKYLFIFILLCTSLLGAEQRIVALAPSINEILFALGKGESVVGNTTYATYPEASKKIPKVGGYFSVSLEKIVALKPTLVLLQRNNLALKPKLEKLGIRTELIRISSLDDLKAGIMRIGELTYTKQRAAEIIEEINDAVKSTVGILKGKKILIVFGVNFDLKKEVFISGNHLYFADIIRASGNQNAFAEETSKQPVISMEGIIALNPDIVYILAHRVKEKETSQLIVPWLKLPVTAARAKTIYVTTQKYAGMPSQRVVLFIRDFKEVLEDAKRKLASLQD
jgi:iron complex transport system substrate-binding protein